MKLQGWQANGAVTGAVVIGLLRWFLVARWNAPTITSAIDATGRCSLFLFSIAFTASSIHRFYPSFLSIVLDTMDTPEQALDWPQLCSITFHPPCADSHDFTLFSRAFPERAIDGAMGVWRSGLSVCLLDGNHVDRQVTTMYGDEALEEASCHWQLLALDCFSSDLHQACERRR